MGVISTLRRLAMSDRFSQQVEDLISHAPMRHLA